MLKFSDLNEKIGEETEKARLNGEYLLNELLHECIEYKALIYFKSNVNLHFSSMNSQDNSIENKEFHFSKSSNYHQNKKANIFLSKKVKNTKKAIDNLTNKALKNNKIVYCHSDISTKESKQIKNDNHHFSQNQDPYYINSQLPLLSQSSPLQPLPLYQRKNRGSIYRGVSRNGNQWQVLIMINKKKRYIGSYSNELEAAKAYDIVALQHHKKKAKTNFYYSEDERKKIISNFILGK